jgi:GNAT superfamily N-acetyltransferase
VTGTKAAVSARAGAEREGLAAPKAVTITVRLAKDEADIAAMIDLGRALHAESRYAAYPYDEARLRQAGQMALAKGNPGAVMAELNGALIGMAVVVAGEHFFSAAKTATAQLLYVAPAHRGGRAAILLLRALRRWAHEAGALDLHVNNTTAIDAARTDRFLRKMGFRQTGGNYVLEGG